MEMMIIFEACHLPLIGGHHSGIRTTYKILQSGYYWPTIHQDVHDYAISFYKCQRKGGISKKNEFPLKSILVIDLINVGGIDFLGPFLSLNMNNTF